MVEKFKRNEENLIPEDQITPAGIKKRVMEFFKGINPDELGVTKNILEMPVRSTLSMSEDSLSSATNYVAYVDASMAIPLATHQIITERAANGEATSRENYSIVKKIPGHFMRIQLSEVNNEFKILINYGRRRGPPENFEKSELIFISAVLKI